MTVTNTINALLSTAEESLILLLCDVLPVVFAAILGEEPWEWVEL